MKWILGITVVLPCILAGCSDHPSKIGVQKEQAIVAAVGAVQADRNGKEAYEAVCARCHGATGEGQPGLYPPLANSRWLTGNPEVPIRIVTNGLAGPIKVRDQDYNGNMVAQRAAFNSDAEMAAALNYARGAWGNQAAVQISAADVTAVAPTGSQESASGLEPLLAEAEAEEASGAGEAVGAAEEAAADGQEGAPSGSE